MCQHHICKQNRAIHINSNKVAEFICQHLEKIPDSTTPLNIFDKLPGGDNIYPCDESTIASLNSLAAECDAMGFPVAVHVSPSMYCVFGRATATNAAGYSHVRVTDTETDVVQKIADLQWSEPNNKKLEGYVHKFMCCYQLAF